jgi:hypothetical protein
MENNTPRNWEGLGYIVVMCVGAIILIMCRASQRFGHLFR